MQEYLFPPGSDIIGKDFAELPAHFILIRKVTWQGGSHLDGNRAGSKQTVTNYSGGYRHKTFLG